MASKTRISRTLFQVVLGITLLVLVLVTFPAPAKADLVSYTYTGNSFNSLQGPYPAGAKVTGTLTFAVALAANLSFTDEASQVVSWSMFDGLHPSSSAATGVLAGAYFATDATGAITKWAILAYDGIATRLYPFNYDNTILTSNATYAVFPGAPATDGTVPVIDITRDSGSGGNSNIRSSPGTWAETVVAPTPEPSTAGMAVLGGAALVLVLRKKRDRLKT